MPAEMSAEYDFYPIQADSLPIYRCDGVEDSLFYTPGHLCRVPLHDAGHFQAQLAAQARPGRAAVEMRRGAQSALQRWQALQDNPFSPECLTLYLNHECRLSCSYCYADPVPGPSARLGPDDILPAAEWVAASCRAQGRPFTVALHGGGEPLIDRVYAGRVLDLLDEIARRHDVPLFCYVATNGVLSKEAVAWLARRCQLVGLSCDGPPAIHDRQRPRRDGGPTSAVVERTARILHAAGTPIHVRATVTPNSLSHLPDIAAYLCAVLAPQVIHVEPVYQGGRAGPADIFRPERAGEFVVALFAARARAREWGIPLRFSGSRLDQVHGPYCHALRNVVNLVPGGLATACFKLATAAQAEALGAVIGRVEPPSRQFEVGRACIESLRHRLLAFPARCRGCFNRYHCTRACPDACPLLADEDAGPSFRCRLQSALTLALLHEAAQHLDVAREQVYGLAGL
jgi:uncharacterized protein